MLPFAEVKRIPYKSYLVMVPIYYESVKTGNRYSWEKYLNHGYGGVHNNMQDLPRDEFPYKIIWKHDEEEREIVIIK